MNTGTTNRWLIAAAGVLMQLGLGAVYAWSVFRTSLAEAYGASVTEVNLAFTITIFTLGFAAFAGGLWMQKVGPRVVGVTAGVLYALGIFLASFAEGNLFLLYLSYGFIAGVGIGLGYIVPIATLVKWFPDKRGIITGIAVGGFGAGAVLTAPIARALIASSGPFATFAILAAIYLVLVGGSALVMKNPPDGYKPAGWEPSTETRSDRSGRDFELGAALRSWQWFALWALLFLNVTAGIAIIAEAAPMAREIGGASVAAATGLVSLIAIFNGIGRFFWASLSDAIGRKWVFLIMFLLQAVLFFALAQVGSYVLFAAIACVIILCYGGGFGTMPAFAADYFGSKRVGQIYGLMLTAWSFGAVVGPILISQIRDSTGEYTNALYILAGVMLVSAILPFIVRPPRAEASAEASGATGRVAVGR